MLPSSLRVIERLSRFVPLERDDLDAISNAIDRRLTVPKKQDIIREGYGGASLYFVEEGLGRRYKLLPNGKRQVLNVILPGDIFGLNTWVFERAIYTVTSFTSMHLCVMSQEKFVSLCWARPAVSVAMLWLAHEDQATIADHLIDIGRRTPLERVAHFLLELKQRIRAISNGPMNTIEIPISQELTGDILGLSAPQVNRMLRRLKELRLIEVGQRSVTIKDAMELQFIAKYERRLLSRISRPS